MYVRTMIQGFETRDNTDVPVRALVDSVNGHMWKKERAVDQYEKTVWPGFDYKFDKPIAVFGMLRGTGQLIEECSRDGQDYYFFDHAYMFGNKHSTSKIAGDRIYRLTKNYFHIRDVKKLKADDYKRIEKYKNHVKLKSWKYDGDYILYIPPSEHVKKYYYFNNHWEEQTLKTIKKHTRKPIKIRTKEDKTPLEKDLENAYCTVSYQSTVVVQSIINGVPSFCANESMGVPVSLTDMTQIKDPLYTPEREYWIDSLLANQFTLEEIKSGLAKETVDRMQK